jgi:hypothetical protein
MADKTLNCAGADAVVALFRDKADDVRQCATTLFAPYDENNYLYSSYLWEATVKAASFFYVKNGTRAAIELPDGLKRERIAFGLIAASVLLGKRVLLLSPTSGVFADLIRDYKQLLHGVPCRFTIFKKAVRYQKSIETMLDFKKYPYTNLLLTAVKHLPTLCEEIEQLRMSNGEVFAPDLIIVCETSRPSMETLQCLELFSSAKRLFLSTPQYSAASNRNVIYERDLLWGMENGFVDEFNIFRYYFNEVSIVKLDISADTRAEWYFLQLKRVIDLLNEVRMEQPRAQFIITANDDAEATLLRDFLLQISKLKVLSRRYAKQPNVGIYNPSAFDSSIILEQLENGELDGVIHTQMVTMKPNCFAVATTFADITRQEKVDEMLSCIATWKGQEQALTYMVVPESFKMDCRLGPLRTFIDQPPYGDYTRAVKRQAESIVNPKHRHCKVIVQTEFIQLVEDSFGELEKENRRPQRGKGRRYF